MVPLTVGLIADPVQASFGGRFGRSSGILLVCRWVLRRNWLVQGGALSLQDMKRSILIFDGRNLKCVRHSSATIPLTLNASNDVWTGYRYDSSLPETSEDN